MRPVVSASKKINMMNSACIIVVIVSSRNHYKIYLYEENRRKEMRCFYGEIYLAGGCFWESGKYFPALRG